MDRVLEHCARKDVSPDGGEYCIVHFPFIENEYYYGILLSFADKCERLEPLHICTKIQQRLRGILALYKT